jgi:hypothetical protein
MRSIYLCGGTLAADDHIRRVSVKIPRTRATALPRPGSTMPKSKVNINLCAVEGQWEAGFPQLLLYSSDTVWRESVGSLTLLFQRSLTPAV